MRLPTASWHFGASSSVRAGFVRSHRFLFASLALLVALTTVLAAWGWVPSNYSQAACKLNNNAAWISVDWTSKPVDRSAVKQLVASASARNVAYLYPYVSYLKRDGTFSTSYAYASDFTSAVHAVGSNIKVLAWVGIPLATDAPIGVRGWVDLSERTTRRKVVEFVRRLVRDSKFDGVHLNAETVRNNDPHFLALLDEVRAELGGQMLISIAGAHHRSDVVGLLPILGDFRWSSDYYGRVASKVDQIATMTYDSYSALAPLYRTWMREQVKAIHDSIANTSAALAIRH